MAELLKFKNAIPTGSILDFAGSTAPEGFFMCDGAEKSIADCSELYIVISTNYNKGRDFLEFQTHRVFLLGEQVLKI